MKRPRRNADRMYLEGWEAGRECLSASSLCARTYCAARLLYYRHAAELRAWTNRERGEVDALLDAFGC